MALNMYYTGSYLQKALVTYASDLVACYGIKSWGSHPLPFQVCKCPSRFTNGLV